MPLFPLHCVHAKPPYMGRIDRPPFCSAKTDIDFGCPPIEMSPESCVRGPLR